MKRKWLDPQLVVLYRGRTDEAILEGCHNCVARAGPGKDCADGTCIARTDSERNPCDIACSRVTPS